MNLKIGQDQFNHIIEDHDSDEVYHAFVSAFTVSKDRKGNPEKILVQMTVLGGPLSQMNFLQEFDLG